MKVVAAFVCVLALLVGVRGETKLRKERIVFPHSITLRLKQAQTVQTHEVLLSAETGACWTVVCCTPALLQRASTKRIESLQDTVHRKLWRISAMLSATLLL